MTDDKPERFECTWWSNGTTAGADMEPDANGEWVRYTDYQTLIAEAVAAEREAIAYEVCEFEEHDAAQHDWTDGEWLAKRIASSIRARTHADALAALAARDKRVRDEALREASIFDLIEEMKRRHNPPRTGLEKVDLSRAAIAKLKGTDDE